MSTCSTCGGTRQDNILRHRPECEFHLPGGGTRIDDRRTEAADMLREHPDLLELEANAAYWYPQEGV